MKRAARAAFGDSALRPSIESSENAKRSRRRSAAIDGAALGAGAGEASVRGGDAQPAAATSSSTVLQRMRSSNGEGMRRRRRQRA